MEMSIRMISFFSEALETTTPRIPYDLWPQTAMILGLQVQVSN